MTKKYAFNGYLSKNHKKKFIEETHNSNCKFSGSELVIFKKDLDKK